MSIAVIGAGRWGENLIRNFSQIGALSYVCDSSEASLARIQSKFPRVRVTKNIDEILADETVKGIVLATPAHTHESLAKKSLQAGKHIYIEKPLARSAKGAKELIEMSSELNLTLMVGHLLLYHPAVNKLKSLIASGELGDIRFLNSDRRNLMSIRGDTSVMWDLAPHDISMISYILDMDSIDVIQAHGFATEGDGVIDVAHLDLKFGDNVYAHIHNSWIDPQKQCLLTVNGSLKTAVINDVLHEQKLALYSIDPRTGQTKVEYPSYDADEPLRLECMHFLHCIESGDRPLTDGFNGYIVVEILEKADNIMRSRLP